MLLCAGAALMLIGCSHPSLVREGTSYESVTEKIGAPDYAERLSDGRIRAVYSQQPMGQTSYVLIFDPSGHLIFRDQLLQQKYFNEIRPGVQTKEDILKFFGKPCEEHQYKNLGESTFMYRYQDAGMHAMALWVDFDDRTGKVLRYVLSLDPWSQRDSEWDLRF